MGWKSIGKLVMEIGHLYLRMNDWQLDTEAAYVYYSDNETIGGLAFHSIPDVGSIPLVFDMTSSYFIQVD